MRTLEEYMTLSYHMEIVPDTYEGGFVAYFPDLPGCVTCADTQEQVIKNANDAKRAWIIAAIEDNLTIPEPAYNQQNSGCRLLNYAEL